jgi:hypothetical protein
MTISELAREAAGYFETATRDNGESFVKTRDDRPEWLTELILDAHENMMPEDWRYEAISRVLDEIANRELETADDVRDDAHEIADGLTEVYNGALIQWLGSNLSRVGYVDEVLAQGIAENTGQLLMLAQSMEYQEIIESVAQSLESRLGELEAA